MKAAFKPLSFVEGGKKGWAFMNQCCTPHCIQKMLFEVSVNGDESFYIYKEHNNDSFTRIIKIIPILIRRRTLTSTASSCQSCPHSSIYIRTLGKPHLEQSSPRMFILFCLLCSEGGLLMPRIIQHRGSGLRGHGLGVQFLRLSCLVFVFLKGGLGFRV